MILHQKLLKEISVVKERSEEDSVISSKLIMSVNIVVVSSNKIVMYDCKSPPLSSLRMTLPVCTHISHRTLTPESMGRLGHEYSWACDAARPIRWGVDEVWRKYHRALEFRCIFNRARQHLNRGGSGRHMHMISLVKIK